MKTPFNLGFLKFIYLLAAFDPGLSVAQMSFDDVVGRPVIGQTGQLFTLSYDHEKQTLLIKGAGEKIGSFSPEQVEVFGHIIRGENQQIHLNISPAQNHFHIEEPIQPTDVVEIEVRKKHPTDKNKTSEKFRFQAQPPGSDKSEVNPEF